MRTPKLNHCFELRCVRFPPFHVLPPDVHHTASFGVHESGSIPVFEFQCNMGRHGQWATAHPLRFEDTLPPSKCGDESLEVECLIGVNRHVSTPMIEHRYRQLNVDNCWFWCRTEFVVPVVREHTSAKQIAACVYSCNEWQWLT